MKMNKDSYLSSISPFIEYLTDMWDGGFSHSYFIKLAAWINFNEGKQWSCLSLRNAQEKYWWNGNYKTSKAKLAFLSRGWNKAVLRGSNKRAKGITLCVFRWGGVLNQGGNRASVSNHPDPDFIRWMIGAKNQLLSGNDAVPDFGNKLLYKMNSAYTKAYAVMDNQLIIYDGRVGAALGLLASRYFMAPSTATPLNNVDFSLVRFPWGAEKTSSRRSVPALQSVRNPSTKDYSFPKLRNDSRQHAIWAVRASWLVEELASRIREKKEIDINVTNRDIEAALFMIGYDVKGLAVNGGAIGNQRGGVKGCQSIRKIGSESPMVTATETADGAEGAQTTPQAKRSKPHATKMQGKSKMDSARRIYSESRNLNRKEIIKKFIDDCGLTKNGASTYYQKLKKEDEKQQSSTENHNTTDSRRLCEFCNLRLATQVIKRWDTWQMKNWTISACSDCAKNNQQTWLT